MCPTPGPLPITGTNLLRPFHPVDGRLQQPRGQGAALLVVQAVESDPELRVQERRTKFYSSLQKATRVFEELTLDDAVDLDAIYEDDMLERLEELQQALSTCIAALRKASPGE